MVMRLTPVKRQERRVGCPFARQFIEEGNVRERVLRSYIHSEVATYLLVLIRDSHRQTKPPRC